MDAALVLTICGLLFTIFAFVIKMLRDDITANQEEVRLLIKTMDGHMLHSTKTFATKDEVVKMIGLISGPIQVSVEKMGDQMKEDKRDGRDDLNKLSIKIDQLLAQNGNRRSND